jgi:hypothetical protein
MKGYLLRCVGRYWHIADIRGTATFCSLLDKSGHCADLVSVRFLPSDNILLSRPTVSHIGSHTPAITYSEGPWSMTLYAQANF